MSFVSEGPLQKSGETFEESTVATHLSPNHRIVYGMVESVNRATINIDSDDARQITPRYLDLEKPGGKADLVN